MPYRVGAGVDTAGLSGGSLVRELRCIILSSARLRRFRPDSTGGLSGLAGCGA